MENEAFELSQVIMKDTSVVALPKIPTALPAEPIASDDAGIKSYVSPKPIPHTKHYVGEF